jgi:transposase-like protein
MNITRSNTTEKSGITMTILSPINPAIPRCPECRAKDVIKKGIRKTRHEARQRWGCNRCGHTFTNLVTKHSR